MSLLQDSGSEVELEWQDCFPFVDDFEHVIDGTVTVDYLEQLTYVLEPVVALFEKTVLGGKVTKETLSVLVHAVNALARCRVALAYVSELQDVSFDKNLLRRMLRFEWTAMVRRERLIKVDRLPAFVEILGPSVLTVWIPVAMRHMYTACDLRRRFPTFVLKVRVVPIGQVLVVGDKGQMLTSLTSAHLDKIVLPADIYRKLWQRLKGVDLQMRERFSPCTLLVGRTEPIDIGYGKLETDLVASWLWVVLASLKDMQGYCYQLLFKPLRRYQMCVVLSAQPLVSEVLHYLSEVENQTWASGSAQFDCATDVLHVKAAGFCDHDWLVEFADRRIGMRRTDFASGEVDYYARALVDDFFP